MKILTILCLKFLLLSNFLMAETIPTKSSIIEKSSQCIKDSQTQECKELVSEIEKLYIIAMHKKGTLFRAPVIVKEIFELQNISLEHYP